MATRSSSDSLFETFVREDPDSSDTDAGLGPGPAFSSGVNHAGASQAASPEYPRDREEQGELEQ
jgi:hypothetical protein